jgi:3-oxoacyl-[acyl-carrier-protein] synthase II
MSKRRVVVTGLGIVSPLGNDVEEYYRSLLAGKSGVSKITGFDVSDYPTQIAGEIKEFDATGYLDKKQARRVDKFIAYTVVAGKKALDYAGVDEQARSSMNPSKCGVIIGSGMGGMDKFVSSVQTMDNRGPNKVSPFFIPFVITNMGGAMMAMEVGFMGPNYSISTACATGNNSIIAAANHIIKGEADLMLAGGAEAPVLPMGVAGFCACRALSKRNDEPEKASRPWDTQRDGFVIGEGAGVIVLESLEHALARGAPILAEYLGGGVSCDAYHMTEPRSDGEGVASCIRSALHDAGVNADSVNYVNAHATSTPLGDMAEVNAVKKVLNQPGKVMMNATKSMIGHGLGAAGGQEAVVCVKAIQEGVVHPTINLESPEPGLDFIIPRQAEELDVNVAISNSFGFGGHNATIVFKKFEK